MLQGTGWGENGYMRIKRGTCDIFARGGLVPILDPNYLASPCSLSPCGGGICTVDRTNVGGYRCSSYPREFAVVGQPQTCGLVDRLGTNFRNGTLNIDTTFSVSFVAFLLSVREMKEDRRKIMSKSKKNHQIRKK